MIEAVIIDDEVKAVDNLQNLVHSFYNEIDIVGTAYSVREGIDLIKKLNPQLLFLDIEMKDGLGFDILKQLTGFKGEVIFVTAYSKYSLDAIRFSAIDYVLKPINDALLREAINKAYKQINLKAENLRLKNLINNSNRINQDKKIALQFIDSIEFIEVKL